MPILFGEAEFDTTVSNDYVRKFYQINKDKNDKARFIELKDVDHTNPCFHEKVCLQFA
jgi:hypothetical protein